MRARDFDGSDKIPRLKKFAKWCRQRLDLDYLPEIEFSNDFDIVKQKRTFGQASSEGPIWVYVGNRNCADIMRTLCHEMIHIKQFKHDLASAGMDARTAQQVEDVANAWAGRIMREYGKNNADIYESKEVHTGIKPSKSAEFAIPGAHRVGGSSDRFYDLLRIMMNVARSDGVDMIPMPQESWVGRNNIAVPYTAIEAEMLKQAYAAAGVEWDDALKPNPDNKSQEHPAINNTSPVASAAPDYRGRRGRNR